MASPLMSHTTDASSFRLGLVSPSPSPSPDLVVESDPFAAFTREEDRALHSSHSTSPSPTRRRDERSSGERGEGRVSGKDASRRAGADESSDDDGYRSRRKAHSQGRSRSAKQKGEGKSGHSRSRKAKAACISDGAACNDPSLHFTSHTHALSPTSAEQSVSSACSSASPSPAPSSSSSLSLSSSAATRSRSRSPPSSRSHDESPREWRGGSSSVLDLSARSSDSLLASSSAEPSRPRATRPPAPRYDTFGETVRSHSGSPLGTSVSLFLAGDFDAWMRHNGFDSTFAARLKSAGYGSFAACMTVSKEACKTIVGVGPGIRLFHALREVEKAAAAASPSNGSSSDGSARASSRPSRPRLSPSSLLPSSSLSSSLAASLASPSRSFQLHPAGLYGHCAVETCNLPASAICVTRTCQRALCTVHACKNLLTASVLCERCYEQQGYLDTIRDTIGINALKDQGYNVEQCVVQ